MTIRLGFVSYALDRARGGIGRYSRDLLGELREGKLRDTVAVTEIRTGRWQIGPDTVALPGARYLPGLLTVGQAEIAWIAQHRRLDLVHDPTGSAPLLFTRTRRVATIHDVIPYLYPQASTILDRLIYRYWLPHMAGQLDAIITISEQSKADIIRHLPVRPDRITVIPHAVSERFRPLRPDDKLAALARLRIKRPFILFVGSAEPRKNLLRLLDAYAELRTWSQSYDLVVVGANGWRSSSVYTHVRKLGLLPFVRFTGYVADEDLVALYTGAEVFVFPSIYEGFGLPVLEAMACGAPVVASKTSSIPEVTGEAALLIDPFDARSIAASIRRVLEDRAFALELCERGIARAQHFTRERFTKQMINLYEKVLDNRRGW